MTLCNFRTLCGMMQRTFKNKVRNFTKLNIYNKVTALYGTKTCYKQKYLNKIQSKEI